MVVYPAGQGQPPRAIYFDSEGHVIQYRVQPAEKPQSLTFVSEPAASTPRFHLTYTEQGQFVSATEGNNLMMIVSARWIVPGDQPRCCPPGGCRLLYELTCVGQRNCLPSQECHHA